MRAKQFCALKTTVSMATIWYQENAFKPSNDLGWCSSKTVVQLLLIHCLLLLVLCLVLVLLFYTLYPSSFAIILMGKRELVALLCQCSVALSHGAMSWYAVCDCGIS